MYRFSHPVQIGTDSNIVEQETTMLNCVQQLVMMLMSSYIMSNEMIIIFCVMLLTFIGHLIIGSINALNSSL